MKKDEKKVNARHERYTDPPSRSHDDASTARTERARRTREAKKRARERSFKTETRRATTCGIQSVA
jgi:hypothetical protein